MQTLIRLVNDNWPLALAALVGWSWYVTLLRVTW